MEHPELSSYGFGRSPPINLSRSSSTNECIYSLQLSNLCTSKSLSLEGLRELIERFGFAQGSTNHDVITENKSYTFFLNVCQNSKVNAEIIRYIIDIFPEAADIADSRGRTPLHHACSKEKVNVDIIRSLVEAAPDTLRRANIYGETPPHLLCRNGRVDSGVADILEFFLEQDPESARKVDKCGRLPLHYACEYQSRECCSALISAYPDSVQIRDNNGTLPLHFACGSKILEKVQYLYELYPNAVDLPTEREGLYPINFAMQGVLGYEFVGIRTGFDTLNVVKYLLDCDPRVKFQKVEKKCGNNIVTRCSHISIFCSLFRKESNEEVDIGIEIIKALYDANPKAIIFCEEHIRDLISPRELLPEFWEFIKGKLESWRGVRETTRLFGEELRNVCGSGSLSLERLRETFNRFGLTKNVDKNELIDCDRIAEGDFFLFVCNNENVNEEIIQFLLDFFPRAPKVMDRCGIAPLHIVCRNKNVTLNIVQLIYKAASDSIFKMTQNGYTPLHMLCWNQWECIDEANLLEILQFLLREYPEAADISDSHGYTPLHIYIAFCIKKYSLDIIKTLIGSLNETAASRVLLRATHEGDTPLHLLWSNKAVDRENFLETLEFLLNKCKAATCTANNKGALPLHCACYNKDDVNVDMIRSLVEAAPDTLRQSMNDEQTPPHLLCRNGRVDSGVADILKFFLEQDPESARKVDVLGRLPLHYACEYQSRECCSALIGAYPDSVQIRDNNGTLPLHFACGSKILEKVQYMYELYPNAVDLPTESEGLYPINFVMQGTLCNDDYDSVNVVRYLLDCDPSVKLQKISSRFGLRRFQLVWFCNQQNSNLNAVTTVQIVRALYDANPKAIYEFEYLSIDMQEEVRTFIEGELVYAGQAKDAAIRSRLEIDENGQLNTALQSNASLGSIKLLVEAYPFAVRVIYSNFSLPLHVACQHHNSASVVQYLLDLAPELLQYSVHGNTILHLACQGAKYETIAMLLGNTTTNTVSLVSRRNDQGKLPIDLLFESSEVEDRESVGYIGAIFGLLQAYPETPCRGL